MTKPEESTPGVVTTRWEIGSIENKTNAHIWDFAGHVITHAAHRCFLSERCVYVILYNGRTEDKSLEYWLDHVRTYGGNAPTWVLINKFDKHNPDIPMETLKDDYGFIRGYPNFSIENDKANLEKFRMEISEYILGNPMWNSVQIPESYYKVKAVLEQKFSQGKDHIDKAEFDRIADESFIEGEDKQLELLKALHWLGICLWYENIKDFNTLVLNPDWITHGIYKIINWSFGRPNRLERHTVALKDYGEIFGGEEERYSADKLRDIFKLMEEYELAYSKGTDKITIPHLLPRDRPSKLPDFPEEESLRIRYVSEKPLPPHPICRLIVKHHADIKSDEDVWRYGAVLKYGTDTIAVAVEKDRTITIDVKGSEKTEYITTLRASMNEIFSSYKSKEPELQYRVILPPELEPQLNAKSAHVSKAYKNIMVKSERLENLNRNNRDYYDDATDTDIPVALTIKNYNISIDSRKSSLLNIDKLDSPSIFGGVKGIDVLSSLK
jgi:hypothetical protein